MHPVVRKVDYITPERFSEVIAFPSGVSGGVTTRIFVRPLVLWLTLVTSSGLGDLKVAHHPGQFF